MKYDAATKYECKYCGKKKFIPERKSEAPRTVKTGCDNCEQITPHKAVTAI